MAHFDRERVPERVVHVKGGGATGYFEVTNTQITKYCCAGLFNRLGKRTPVRVRFSTVIGEQGAADTVRDLRGFSVRFYTEEGNWDLVGLSAPMFFVRDPFQFMRFVHSQKRNPETNLFDNNARWDFITLRPEVLHAITWMFGDRGIPDGFRHMDAHGQHTFKLVNSSQHAVYTKFHWRSNQGIKNLDVDTANQLAASNPDYSIQDLYNAIERKQYPNWIFYIQVMTFEEARTWEFNPFDLTKIWPEDQFPLIEVGRLTLDRNPENYHVEVEQLALCPANLIPGIELSPDKMLHARIFSYPDTQRHRIGPNFHLVQVNQPKVPVLTPTIRDGPMNTSSNEVNMPNYYPCSFMPGVFANSERHNQLRTHLGATDVDRFESADEDNYSQIRDPFLSFSVEERARLCTNIGAQLGLAYDFIQKRALGHFEKIHSDYAEGVRRALRQTANQTNSA